MRRSRSGGQFVSRAPRPSAGFLAAQGPETIPVKNAILSQGREGGETAIAAAFRRALEARKIDIKEVPRLKDNDARAVFSDVRWADTDGRPTCPRCGAESPYTLASRIGSYSCRNSSCRCNFSTTSKTLFSSRKTSFQTILIGLGALVRGDNATELMAETGLSYKAAWQFGRRLGGLRDGRRREIMPYPFRPDHFNVPGGDLLSIITSHLPHNLPQEMREDVSQELCLAVLCGDVSRDNIVAAIPSYMRAYNRMFRGKFGEYSLSAPIGGQEEGITLGDMLQGERSFEYWERA